jgi:2-keto-3-deoxy-L-rhamnonate aldolase RhmA
VVLAFTMVASEVEAVFTTVLVLELTALWEAVTAAAKLVEAVRTELLVLVLTEVMAEATWLVVLAFTTAASEEEAVVTSLWTAKFPAERPALVRLLVPYVQTSAAVMEPPVVRLLVPFVQTSAARVPKVVRDLVGAAHTAAGIVT